MRFIRPRFRFRLRSLLLLVAVAAILSERVVLWLRPPTPRLMVQGVRLLGRQCTILGASGRYEPPGPRLMLMRKQLAARDPDLIYYCLIHLHGRELLTYSRSDLLAIRHHLNPGNGVAGTLFADADPGNPAFDADFPRFVEELFPYHPMVPIPTDDELYSDHFADDLSDVQYSRAAGGRRGWPRLEGVKVNGQ